MTKRYDLSKIMRRAWELVKKAAMSISDGLRKAWREAKMAVENTLPALKGSEKQIAWAEKIRTEMLEKMASFVKSEQEAHGDMAGYAEALQMAYDRAVQETRSWIWIDWRNMSAKSAMMDVARMIRDERAAQ